MISKTVDSTNLNFRRSLGLSMKCKKQMAGLISLVRFSGQLIYVRVLFNQIVLRNDRKSKMTKVLSKFQNLL